MNTEASFSNKGVIRGVYRPPGDKSISHRAVMFASLADGESHIRNFLESGDCLHTLMAFQRMGVKAVHEKGSGELRIQANGLRGLSLDSSEPIYLGNSGTSMRLILGILAGQRFEATLTGDPSLSSRPMKRVTQPLKQMGAQIKGKDNGNFAPLTIRGGKLKGIEFDNHLSSAQVKSAILLAGLYADGKTRVKEEIPSRDHTERFLSFVGAPVKKEGPWIEVEKTSRLNNFNLEVPGDISSAAFFITAAAMIPGSELRVEKVGLNPGRLGFVDVLKRMGSQITVELQNEKPEPVGVISVKGTRLSGTRVMKSEIPSVIDELPILMIAMALADGESLISGAEELRVKETDRIASMVENLRAVGGQAEELPDGCMIKGVRELNGGRTRSCGDHRTAMSFAVASLAARNRIEIDDFDCVSTSFPGFSGDFKGVIK